MRILHFITVSPVTTPFFETLCASIASDEQMEQELVVYYRGVPIRRDARFHVLNPESTRIGKSY